MGIGPKESQASDADIALNKLALKQVKLGSWFPDTGGREANQVSADDEDFDALDDAAGLGAPKAEKDAADNQIDLLLKKRKMSNQKLLETLIGKKAAEAMRKSQAAAKSNIATPHAAPKPATSSIRTHHCEDSDDEESSRVAAFASKRKTRDNNLPAYTTGGADSPAQIDEDAEPTDPREEIATITALAGGDQVQKEQDSEEEQRPSKRKPTSYLDELLSCKKKKKRKGKAKAQA